MYGQLVYINSMIPQIILVFYMFTSKPTCYCCVIFLCENFICIYHISSSRLYFNVGKFKYFNLSSYVSILTAITGFVALFCIFSNFSISSL